MVLLRSGKRKRKKKAIELNPSHLDVCDWAFTVVFAGITGKEHYQEADEALQKVVEAEPNNIKALALFAYIADSRRLDDKSARAEKAIAECDKRLSCSFLEGYRSVGR